MTVEGQVGSLTPHEARATLRRTLFEAAAAAVPDQQPMLVSDLGPSLIGAVVDGGGTEVTSRIRVEIGDPARTGQASDRVRAARRHLHQRGWSVIRSTDEPARSELVAVHDGFVIVVSARTAERRLVFTGETPALPGR